MKTVYLIVVISAAGVSAVFDCRRDAANLCKNGASCDTSPSSIGACNACPADYEGYDCSVVTADKSHADCISNPCMNGGTCHKAVAGPLKCLCDEDYIGPTCAAKRYDLTCNFAGDGSMDMAITPHVPNFVGSVYVKDKKSEASCVFSQMGGPGSPYELSPLGNNDVTCGSTTNADGKKKRFVIIQFMSGTTSDQDELVTFVCGTGNIITGQSSPLTISAVEAALHESGADHAPLNEDIDMTLTPTTANLDGSINMGTTITVQADLTAIGDGKFAAIRIESCMASNLPDPAVPGYDFDYFIDNSCPHSDLAHVMQSAIVKTGGLIFFKFSAFKFDDFDSMYITCDVKTCPLQLAANCDAVSCDGGSTFNGNGRKKRETGTRKNGTIDKILQRSITIKDPFVVAAANTLKEFKETKACYQSWEMTATVVALAVALVLVMFICIVLIVKAILNRKRGPMYREDLSETTSTSHFPGLPTIVPNKQ